MSKAHTQRRPHKQPQRGRQNQRWLVLALVGVVVIGLAAGLAYWRAGGTPTAEGLPPSISVAEAAEKREAGAFVLDVREPDEWAEVHIPGTTLIPLRELAARAAELPRDQEIVVICRSGNRSQQGRDILLAAGFDRVTSMAGGVTEWRAQGLPTVTGP
jgi:rhodanese-related sulfurtransferase